MLGDRLDVNSFRPEKSVEFIEPIAPLLRFHFKQSKRSPDWYDQPKASVLGVLFRFVLDDRKKWVGQKVWFQSLAETTAMTAVCHSEKDTVSAVRINETQKFHL